jgi:endonuclease/exonuclease/phosphatase family metal-dependent hydrolase
MKGFVRLFIVALAILPVTSLAQEGQTRIRIAFWNMENFFDPFVDSTTTYNAFTDSGVQHWTKSRFYNKRNNMYKAILALSEGQPIGIMGVCEVENEYVLNATFRQTPLKAHNYRWVHYEGPDRRGTEPAIVYSLDHFMLVESAVFPYFNPEDTAYRSRDILYAKFIDKQDDTIYVFVNHWPSRYSGEMETAGSRSCSATLLRSKVDSICSSSPEGYQAKIIMIGDFNDSPSDPSVHDVLLARHPSEWEEGCLVNLFGKSKDFDIEGTLKHLTDWQIFDQIIVTPNLMDDKKGVHYQAGSARIFHPDFMLQNDETYHGKKPYRTYLGPRYIGGFSDHLPVYIDLTR